MNKKTGIILILLLMIAFGTIFTACIDNSARQFSVVYTATEGGYIEGDNNQTVKYGESASKVTARASEGYRFVSWSDGKCQTPERTDKYISAEIFSAANFEKIAQTFTYIYNEATGNNLQESIELKYANLDELSLIVPTRDNFIFKGWYSDWLFTTQVSNEQGELIIGSDIFNSESNNLYARWTAVEEIKYKILMVFVTEAQATLTATNGENIEVNYKMTETERQVCELIGPMLVQYLNAMLNGLVTFEIDTYFTEIAVGKENFFQGTTNPLGSSEIVFDYGMHAYNIPEVSGMIDNYRSVITTFNLNDYESLLHVTAGSAGQKYASIHGESIFRGQVINDQPIELLLDFFYPGVAAGWESFMTLYLHEFTHTVESWPEVEEYNGIYYHEILKYYRETVDPINGVISEIEVIRLYLLHQTEVNGKSVGIPLWFWNNQ